MFKLLLLTLLFTSCVNVDTEVMEVVELEKKVLAAPFRIHNDCLFARNIISLASTELVLLGGQMRLTEFNKQYNDLKILSNLFFEKCTKEKL